MISEKEMRNVEFSYEKMNFLVQQSHVGLNGLLTNTSLAGGSAAHLRKNIHGAYVGFITYNS